MKPAAAYIFDFDGTLADSCKHSVNAKLEVCDMMGLPRPDEDFLTSMTGMGVEDTFVLATGIEDVATRREAIDLYHPLFLKRTLADMRLFPGAMETLRELRRRGAKIGVISMRRPADLDALIHAGGLDKLVDAWITETEAGRPKPAPDMIRNLTDRFGIDPADAIVIGDTIYDLELAKNSGARAIGVTFGAQSERILRRYNPETLITSLSELLA